MLGIIGWAAVFLGVAATAFGVFLYSPALCLAGAFLLACAYCAAAASQQIKLSASGPVKSYAGRKIQVKYMIEPALPGWITGVKIDEAQSVSISRKGRVWHVDAQWLPKSPGMLNFPVAEILHTDPFFLSGKKMKVQPGEKILVLPSAGFLLQTRNQALSKSAGSKKSKIMGGIDEFVALREYVMGDDIRMIDWKATARTGEYHVREMVGYKNERIMVVADLTKASYHGGFRDALVDDALRLAIGHLSIGDAVGFFIACAKPQFIRPSSSMKNYDAIAHALGNSECGGIFDLLEVSRRLAATSPRGMKVFILSNALEMQNLRKGVDHLIAQNHRVCIFSYFEPDFKRSGDPLALAAGQLASEKLAELEKEYKKKRVRIIRVGREQQKKIAFL